MCGIAGVVRLRGRTEDEDRVAVARMLRAQSHRGPDGHDVYFDEAIVLGHARLAIIDLSAAGREPMANETGDVWISYNGEIYNYRELRAVLRGFDHVFRSQTDAEVLLHGYEQWGMEGLLARLRGMFAFALYDARSQLRPRFFLVRDRFGIKPLYFAGSGERLTFSSELTAIVSSGLVAPELAPEALSSFLALGSVPGPGSAVRDVETVPAAHYLELDRGRCSLRRYWKLAAPEDGDGTADDSKNIGELLSESVRLHLVSDVPLGVFSSGGVDSATLVALASRFVDEPVTTLSVVFDDAGLNEARYAKRVAEAYGTDHREVAIDGNEFLETLPDIFRAMDSPTVDGVNTFFVSRAAKRAGLTVVLTGLGGDEVFLGYPHYRTLSRLEPLVRIFGHTPERVRAAAITVLRAICRKDKLDYLTSPTASNLYLMFRGLFTPRQIAKLLGVERARPSSPPAEATGLVDATARLEIDHYLQHQLLRDTDAMSMTHSIEARVPFLDHRLVEAVFRVPHREKLSSRVNKPLLLSALPEPLPREIWDRPKQGFTLPFHRWLRKHHVELRERSRAADVFFRDAVDETWDRFADGRLHWSRPWALVVVASWIERLRAAPGVARDEPLLASVPRR